MRLVLFVLAAGSILLVASLAGASRAVPGGESGAPGEAAGGKVLSVSGTEDFEVTGDGTAKAWAPVEWTSLERRGEGGHAYTARFKSLYSTTGIYFLLQGSDRQLTSSYPEDFMDLWKEDVFEVFLWTDERYPVYFEYEISPLGKELPILIPNFDGKFLGWRPWHYEGDRRTRKATAAQGGELKSGAAVEGWTAEVFIPYTLLNPLGKVPPKAGDRWRMNVYRVDHDGGRSTGWHWAPVGPSFHEFERFGTILFR